jgi:hypothetical protein
VAIRITPRLRRVESVRRNLDDSGDELLSLRWVCLYNLSCDVVVHILSFSCQLHPKAPNQILIGAHWNTCSEGEKGCCKEHDK